MPTYSNANAKIKNWIFHAQFKGNSFLLGINLNDFWSSTIWAIRISLSFAQFKDPKNTGIQHYRLFLRSPRVRTIIIGSKIEWQCHNHFFNVLQLHLELKWTVCFNILCNRLNCHSHTVCQILFIDESSSFEVLLTFSKSVDVSNTNWRIQYREKSENWT